MINNEYLGLVCDAEEHDPEDEPAYLEWGYERGQEEQLRKKACEDGWTTVKFPGAPWRTAEDRCPDHPAPALPEVPDNTVEVRG